MCAASGAWDAVQLAGGQVACCGGAAGRGRHAAHLDCGLTAARPVPPACPLLALCRRGIWQGARVAVKVREYQEEAPAALEGAGAGAGASVGGTELSGMLSDLGADAPALSAALSARAGTPHIGSSSQASSFGNAPLVEALLSRWAATVVVWLGGWLGGWRALLQPQGLHGSAQLARLYGSPGRPDCRAVHALRRTPAGSCCTRTSCAPTPTASARAWRWRAAGGASARCGSSRSVRWGRAKGRGFLLPPRLLLLPLLLPLVPLPLLTVPPLPPRTPKHPSTLGCSPRLRRFSCRVARRSCAAWARCCGPSSAAGSRTLPAAARAPSWCCARCAAARLPPLPLIAARCRWCAGHASGSRSGHLCAFGCLLPPAVHMPACAACPASKLLHLPSSLAGGGDCQRAVLPAPRGHRPRCGEGGRCQLLSDERLLGGSAWRKAAPRGSGRQRCCPHHPTEAHPTRRRPSRRQHPAAATSTVLHPPQPQ